MKSQGARSLATAPWQPRLALSDDLLAVHALISHPQVLAHLGHRHARLLDFEPIYKDLLDGGELHTRWQEGRLVAMYHLRPGLGPGSVYLSYLALHPDLCGRGLGRQLLAEVIAFCRDAGTRGIELIVARHNAVALALYRGAGFVSAAGSPNPPDAGGDDLLLQLTL